MKVNVIKGDITKINCDAIVNPTDTKFSGGGTLDKIIHDKAGRVPMRKACNQLGSIHVSQAKTTPGFNLRAKYVIQTVGPRWHGDHYGEASLLASCYRNCIIQAVRHHCKSIAFPSISTGAFHYPVNLASQTAIKTLKMFNVSVPLKVILVCYDNRTYYAYLKANKE